MTGTSVRIVLVRHGETVANTEGRWQGQSDSPLTERGWEQARLLAQALAREPLAAVYSSPLGRAMNTARLVAEPHGLPPLASSRLIELNVGSWTDRLASEIREESPELSRAWKDSPWSVRLPGGETMAELQDRALAFFDEAMPRHLGETVAVISHGAIIYTVVTHALERPLTDLWLKEARFSNCQIGRLEWMPGRGLSIVDLCEISHLEPVGVITGWRVAEPHPNVARSGA
jgi:alpha-ribazole phosphatase/probable phosphoglycerate mutase